MRLLIMDGNTVANVIEVDPTNIPPEFSSAPVAPDGVGVGMVWDGAAYVTPEPDPLEVLEMARAAAVIDRTAFLIGLVGLGVITEATALEASDGTWPASLDPFLDGLPLAEKMTVKSAWRAADRVPYDSIVLQTVAAYTQTEASPVTVSQAQLDTLFGVAA